MPAVYTQSLPAMAPLIDAQYGVSLDEIVIAPSQSIVVGQVLGSIGVTSAETVSSAAGAGNSGNGVMGAVTTGQAAVNGVYEIVMLKAGALGVAAEFEVMTPDGTVDGTGAVGAAYAGAINFTIAAGSAYFAVGDTFGVTVTRPFGEAGDQFEAWNPAATGGSQTAVAIAMYPATTAAGQTARVVALRREGTVRASDLTWNASATPAQIAYATQQLAAKRIILR